MSRSLERLFAVAVASVISAVLWYADFLPLALCVIAGAIAYFATNYWLWIKSKRIRAAKAN